ncbi:MAG: hypothetical protein HYS41_02100 [Candidatus Omnitrophica bacterium]|nr:hypothetical protein [Candidatus Omnitrophota bacterium]
MSCSRGNAKIARSAGALALTLLAAPAYPYQADVELIPPGRYAEVTVREIRQAKTSIHLVMYLISLPPTKTSSVVHQLLDALVEAQSRGVAVQVVLDENVDWSEDSVLNFQAVSEKNGPAARYLQARGVRVFFDDATMFTHAKTLVIDETTTILGSANWSETALTQSVETNTLIRSSAFAREVLRSLAAVARHASAAGAAEGVPVSWAFLGDPALLGRLVAARDVRALDLYLLLLRRFDGNPEGRVAIHDETIREALGVRKYPDWQNTVWKVLRRLERRYGLITATAGQDRTVRLKTPGRPSEPYQAPLNATVRVPAGYWEWGWHRTLTLPGKVMYLLGQHYAAVSPTAPVWFHSLEHLQAAHGFSSEFAQRGLRELRRRNLVDAKADVLAPGQYHRRKANRYVLRALYDPAVPAKQLAALEVRHGRQTVRRAAAYAALVYEDNDVGAIERLIQLETLYGPSVVRTAARKIGAMHGSNPKRTAAYLIRTIEGIGRDTARGK